jgi:pheromone shutdown protein TraB
VADERVQVEIGFDGSQIMIARVSSQSADELDRALESGADGIVALDADDGRYAVALRKVAYVKRFARESRVGFGAG